MNLETILKHYLVAALWTEELDSFDTEDIAKECIERAKKDIKAFVTACDGLLDEWDSEQIGHDFWLTRNGHGAGFWDRDLPNAKAITDICEAYRISAHVFTTNGEVHIEY